MCIRDSANTDSATWSNTYKPKKSCIRATLRLDAPLPTQTAGEGMRTVIAYSGRQINENLGQTNYHQGHCKCDERGRDNFPFPFNPPPPPPPPPPHTPEIPAVPFIRKSRRRIASNGPYMNIDGFSLGHIMMVFTCPGGCLFLPLLNPFPRTSNFG